MLEILLLFLLKFSLLPGLSTQKSRPFCPTDGFLRNVIALFYFFPVLQAPESLDITAFLIRDSHMYSPSFSKAMMRLLTPIMFAAMPTQPSL